MAGEDGGDLIRARDARIDALTQALARLEALQAEHLSRLEALQAHNNVIGGLLLEMQRKRGWRERLPPALLRMLTRAKRGLTVLPLLPGILREAKPRAMIAARRGGRWQSRLSLTALAKHAGRRMRAHVSGVSSTIYRVRMKHKLVAGPRPRVLHAIANVFVGGSTQLIVDLFDHLGHAYDMHVATSALPPGERHEGMILHHLPQPLGPDAAFDLMRKFAPDIVHLHYWGESDTPWYQSILAAAKAYGARIVLNVNTPVAPLADAAIDATVYVSNTVREAFGLGGPRESVIHPGIDLTRFTPPARKPALATRSIGMVYRLERDKLDENAIDVFIETVRLRPDTRVFIIGDGTLFETFVNKVEAAGQRGNFTFTGYVPYEDLPALYAQFSIFVAPVWKESFGQVTPFAMAMGSAVAGMRIGALPEILGGASTLGQSTQDTAQKIAALLDDPEKREALGEANRRRALALFSVETMTARYDALYARLLGQKHDLLPGYPAAEIFADAAE